MKLHLAILRWWWIAISIVLVGLVSVGVRVLHSPTTYQSQVRLEVTAPQFEDISLFATGNRSSSYLRDDLTLVRNNLTAVIRSDEVRDQAVRSLNLTAPNSEYTVEVRPVTDSDFIDVIVAARTPELAQIIADQHAATALRYYGQLRAMPAAAMKQFLADQIASAKSSDVTSSSAAGSADSRTTSADPSFALVENQQAQDNYKLLLAKQDEAALLEQQALRATYIQVASTATEPVRRSPLRAFANVIGMTLVGSFALAVMVALLLDALFYRDPPGEEEGEEAAEGVPFLVAHRG